MKNKELFDYSLAMSYDDMQAMVKSIIESTGNELNLVFSMFDTVETPKGKWSPEKWQVKLPDITSKKPVFQGKTVFSAKYEGYRGQVIENPTWREILMEANRAANGDHMFLESLEVDKVKDGITYVEMWFGS